MSRQARSFRWWLSSFALAVCLPPIVALFWNYATQLQRERQDARDTALRVARATAAHLDASQRASHQLLDQLAQRPAISNFGGSCDSLFAIVDVFSQYLNLFLFDPGGELICSGEPVDINERAISKEAERWLREELTSDRQIPSGPMLRQIGERWISALATQVPSPGTAPRMLALVELHDGFDPEGLDPDSVLMIADGQGTILARSKDSSGWTGRNLRKSNIGDLMFELGEGKAESRGVDGVVRQYGFTTLPDIDWHVTVGVPASTVMGPVRKRFLQSISVSLLVMVLVVAVALIMARSVVGPVNALAEAAEALAGGQVREIPSDGRHPREIAGLTRAFNEMAEKRTRAEREMGESEQRLKALSERLLEAQESERRRIARELHDDLGQSLTALKMDVIGLLRRTGDPDDTGSLRDRILRTLDSTVTSVQQISADLRPSMLDDLGLVPAIEQQARLFEERTGIECELSLTPENVALDPQVATALYRVIQEALTNVLRHADATRVEIRMRLRADELVLEVRDDGRGITSEELSSAESIGLQGIRERTSMAGGSVEIEGFPGRGTIVSVRIPAKEHVR